MARFEGAANGTRDALVVAWAAASACASHAAPSAASAAADPVADVPSTDAVAPAPSSDGRIPCDDLTTVARLAALHAAFVGPPIAHPMTLHARLHRATGETDEDFSWDATRDVHRGDGTGGGAASSGVDDDGPWSLDETGVSFA